MESVEVEVNPSAVRRFSRIRTAFSVPIYILFIFLTGRHISVAALFLFLQLLFLFLPPFSSFFFSSLFPCSFPSTPGEWVDFYRACVHTRFVALAIHRYVHRLWGREKYHYHYYCCCCYYYWIWMWFALLGGWVQATSWINKIKLICILRIYQDSVEID
ncbi:hypothetical protein BO70DRAFT_131289 [Aspergillus heteromorphus CBS 117.55]|uniref:Uncharacterized protein n=1 Tax=Aspergillus heteromorphus CBS 117.55 TaxID=1448321 RepID=A0A317WXL0_9EURO|nr:uncharacterized protein BO70DRAFT_131289 [Aspergillus heteromorphus CBS 117.55]PWY89957.1 hypothetical protein BO70DRAFT_131289 [Aspergillus heteromorphus CBS 117.55]